MVKKQKNKNKTIISITRIAAQARFLISIAYYPPIGLDAASGKILSLLHSYSPDTFMIISRDFNYVTLVSTVAVFQQAFATALPGRTAQLSTNVKDAYRVTALYTHEHLLSAAS